MEASEQGTPPVTESEPAAPEEAPEAQGPAVDQSPVASARDAAITGDSGLFEQQPQPVAADPNSPHRTSAPPASLQSGVPLAEDRAAGVQAGEPGARPAPAGAEPEAEQH